MTSVGMRANTPELTKRFQEWIDLEKRAGDVASANDAAHQADLCRTNILYRLFVFGKHIPDKNHHDPELAKK